MRIKEYGLPLNWSVYYAGMKKNFITPEQVIDLLLEGNFEYSEKDLIELINIQNEREDMLEKLRELSEGDFNSGLRVWQLSFLIKIQEADKEIGEKLKDIEETRDILDASSIVNINLNFGEENDESKKEYTKEEKMIADAILEDLDEQGEKIILIYDGMGYIPIADVGQDLVEGEYVSAIATAGGYFIPVGKILGPGLKFANKKLIQHAHQWGIVEKGVALTSNQLKVMQKITQHIYKKATVIRQGTWGNPAAGGFDNALFYSNGSHVVVTQADGTMITLLRNGTGNKHFNAASTIWTK